MGITVLGTRVVNGIVEGAQRAWLRPPETHIRRRELPYWQERGWQRAGGMFTGSYQTPYGSFLGQVEDRGGNYFRFYIVDPPEPLRRTSHWACFLPRGNRGYQVHMARRPNDVSSGIMTIERLITDACSR
jgi:hypothetical protein